MGLGSLLERVKDAIFADPSNPYKQGDNHGLIEQITDLFRGHSQNQQQGGQFGNVRPASQDPLGDPADQFDDGRHAGNRGYDDTPDQLRQRYPNLRPASQDPLGDPADMER